MGDHLAGGRRTDSAARRFLAQPKMSSVIMVISDVLGQKPPEMTLVQSDDVVEPPPATASDPAFRHSVLPRALAGGLHGSDLHRANRGRNVQSVFCVAIKDEEPGGRLIRKCFPQLLANPGASRMTSNVEVEDAPAVMADDEEAIQEVEADRRHGEEIHGGDGFAMITKKSQPAPSRLWICGRPFDPAGDGLLRNIEPQHEELAVNPRSAPGRVLRHHAENQIPNLLRNSLSANALPRPGDQAPVHAEAGTVPADHGLGSDHYKGVFPSGPEPASEHPEEFVQRAELWFKVLPLQYSELLTKRQILKKQALT